METLWQDVRYGVRMLAKSPGYAAVTVLTLALGIGATTAIFSMVNGGLRRPPAYPQSQRLVPANLLETLLVQPAIGRAFASEEEEGSSRVAIISDGLWRRRFSADPSVLGGAITLDDQEHTIIGVLPAAFPFPNVHPWGAAEMEISSRPSIFVPKVFAPWERDSLMG